MKKEESRMQNAHAPRRVLHYFFILPSAFCILLVRVYKFTLSPFIAVLAGPSGACRFEPSCSQYAIEALKTHGAMHGTWLATKRICRCHPGGACGEDPVPPKQFKSAHIDFSPRLSSVALAKEDRI
jgi:putative membrane protein insertion efficiency factor